MKKLSKLFPLGIVLFAALLLSLQHALRPYFYNEDTYVKAQKQKEQESFRRRLSRGLDQDLPWPGMKAAQVSWAWLELLQGVHVESSYDGDFSWMFSKLYFVAQNANLSEIRFLATLAPFYFVIATDGAGSSLFVDELVRKAPDDFNVNFWSGYHAFENLSIPKMAAYFYERASLSPRAPPYLATLSQRLKLGGFDGLTHDQRRDALEKTANPEILERIKKAHPDWF